MQAQDDVCQRARTGRSASKAGEIAHLATSLLLIQGQVRRGGEPACAQAETHVGTLFARERSVMLLLLLRSDARLPRVTPETTARGPWRLL